MLTYAKMHHDSVLSKFCCNRIANDLDFDIQNGPMTNVPIESQWATAYVSLIVIFALYVTVWDIHCQNLKDLDVYLQNDTASHVNTSLESQ